MMGTPLAYMHRMNGADPTTPEEIERILRMVSRTRPADVEDDSFDDFEALCRLLAAEHEAPAPYAPMRAPLRRVA